jgi:ribosomal protein L13
VNTSADPAAAVWRFFHGRGWPPVGSLSEDVDGLTWFQARARAEMVLGPMLDDECGDCRSQAVEAALVLERLAPGEEFHGEVDGADVVVVPMADVVGGASEEQQVDEQHTAQASGAEKVDEGGLGGFRSVRLVIEVVAGLLPGGKPDPQYTRKFAIFSDEWSAAREHDRTAEPGGGTAASELLASANGRAQGYAGWLMMQPGAVNWVRTDWVWM